MLYRVKQFFKAITAKLTEDDYRFINFYLNERERQFFYRLNKSEQYHSVNVARCVLETSIKEGCYDIILVKAALLHDIGKIDSGLNPITKSIMVILDRFFGQRLKNVKGVKFIRAYYDHPKIALDYLGNKKNYLAFLIENHHNYSINDRKLKLLQEADCKN